MAPGSDIVYPWDVAGTGKVPAAWPPTSWPSSRYTLIADETANRRARAVNRELWNAWTAIHESSEFYDLEGFRAGRSSLNPIEIAELGDVAGKSLLHLQCHFGLDTLSWARRGARVTGVDVSDESIELARRLADELAGELESPARFVRSDVYDVPAVLGETFDVVFTSYGVLDWLPDLDRWARAAASCLRPGGTFYIVEFHPAALVLGEDKSFAYPYFPSAGPLRQVVHGSYADPDADLTHDSYQWCHSLGEIVTAVAAAGLRIEFLHEFPDSPYDCFPFTTEVEPGRAVIAGLEDKVPLVFSLRAVRESRRRRDPSTTRSPPGRRAAPTTP